MSLRSKRPLDSRSRGDSPPDKRSRPPEPRPARQDRYANTNAPAFLSPPSSRKSSLAGLPPKARTGSRLSPDHHRPNSAVERSLRQEQGRDNQSFINNVRNRSPSSIGSGASTPTGQAALLVPSMLPLAVARQHQDEATGPITMQALRRLKARKKDIASHASAAVATQEDSPAPAASTPKSIELQLKVHQLEIGHLKKEREGLINRLKKIEASVQQHDTQADVSTEVQTLKNRMNSIEAFSLGTELPSLRTGIEELKPSLNSIANLSNLEQQVKPVLDKIDDFKSSLGSRISDLEKQTEQLKPLSDKVDQLANPSLQGGGNKDQTAMNKVKKDLTTFLERKINAQTIQITKLESSINALPKPASEQHIKELVLQEVMTKTDEARKIFQRDCKAVEEELKQVMNDTQQSLSEVRTQVGTFQTFKETTERQNITARFEDLQNRLLDAVSNNDKTFAKIEKLNDRYDHFKARTDDGLEHLNKYCKNLRKELHDNLYEYLKKYLQDKLMEKLYDDIYDNVLKSLSKKDNEFRATTEDAIKKLTRNVDHLLNDTSIFDSVKKLTSRVDELENKDDAVEKIARKSKFNKVGTRIQVPSSPSSNDNSMAETSSSNPNQRITQLETDLDNLRQAFDKVKGFAADVTAINGRLEKAEATLEGLSKLEQQVAEHESLRSSITALDARFTDSIQALQQAQSTRPTIIQPQISGPSSIPDGAATNASPGALDQFNASLNGLLNEMERIDDEVNNALMAINTQGTKIESVGNIVPDLFKKQFDPFKTKVEDLISTLDGRLEQYHQNMVSMRQEMLSLQAQPQQTTFGHAQQAQLNSIITETSALKRNLSALESALETKVDGTTHDSHITALNFAFHNLETRYDNITTDELYKRITRWFVQTYPDTSDLLNMSRRISQMLQDIEQLKHSHGQIAWVQASASDIQGLCRNATQLQQLAKDMPQLQQIASNSSQLRELVESPRQPSDMLAKIDVAYNNAQSAFCKAEEGLGRMDEQGKMLANLESRIEGLQSSIRVLTSSTASLVKPEALNDLTTTLQKRLQQVKSELTAGMQELRKSSDDKIQDICVSSQGNVEELRKRNDSQAAELRTTDGKIAEFQSKLNRFEGARTVSDIRIQELEKYQSKLNDKIDDSQRDSEKKIETLRTRLFDEANEMHANLDAVKEELLTTIGADKKESLAKIDDTGTELPEKVNTDLVAKIGVQKKVLMSKIDDLVTKVDNEKKDAITRSEDVRTKLLATLDDRVKALLTTINASKEESLTTAEGNKNELLAKIEILRKDLLTKIATEKKQVGANLQRDQSKRERAEDDLRKLINDAKDDANQNVTRVRESLATLQTELDAMTTLVEPNRAFLGSLGSLYVVVVQLQQLFESLNQNTGVAPLEFNWAYYLANLLPDAKPNGTGSRKPSLA
ncbi:Myosin-tail-1 multi-domain protein [Pyrenophora tritici-repentis]|nr:Myosin-tail-1 multi-domain protein [Pyrenophora tritici-repentis]KAI1598845.1 Myosin-tail-1 multi-domain protein [Pyrenophora tritici-repentis]